MSVGDIDADIDMGKHLQSIIASTLSVHPLLKSNVQDAMTIAKGAVFYTEPIVVERPEFALNGKGWIEAKFGKSVDEIKLELAKAHEYGLLDDELEPIMKSIDTLQEMESQATVASMEWADGYYEVMKELGLDERTLKALRIHGNVRKSTLIRACNEWQSANQILKTLDEFQDVWGEEETTAWKSAMTQKQDAKQIWNNTLHQYDTLNKEQKKWLKMAYEELNKSGPLTARIIGERMIDKGIKRVNVNRLAKLLKMYGEDVGIIKSMKKSEYIAVGESELIIKDVWPYAASIIDEHAVFKISQRGDPSVTLVTKGDRGRIHCNQLYKQIGFGKLQLNNRVQKGEPMEHRIEFLEEDVSKLLVGSLPYIEEKSEIAKAMSLYILGEDDSSILNKIMEEE